MGGYVIELPFNKSEALEILFDIINDKLIDATMGNMAIELVTYNINYHVFVISSVTFQQSVAGVIYPLTRSRAIRKNLYASSLDKFRACQELFYIGMILFYLFKEIQHFSRLWRKVVKEVSFRQSVIFHIYSFIAHSHLICHRTTKTRLFYTLQKIQYGSRSFVIS